MKIVIHEVLKHILFYLGNFYFVIFSEKSLKKCTIFQKIHPLSCNISHIYQKCNDLMEENH